MDKRAAQIARQIEAEIIRRGWPIGESLGSEQSLQREYDVSRSVLREAIRLVEHHQVARMRRGRGGGLIVTAPDASPATRAVVIYLEYLGTTIEELLAARLLLEPLASGLAAERIDESGIARLRDLLSTHRPQPDADDFHVTLGALTSNPVLALFIDVLTRLTARYGEDSERPPAGEADAAIDRLVADHTAIVEAVTAGDAARARTLTQQHVQTVTALLDRHYRPRRGTRPRAATPGGPEGKRAEVLAATVYQDIVAGGWQTGSVFGAESELLERYGVSRPVLREAVRLLEYHTVARMRRGPGGGLIVTEPQPQASVDTIALYLEYRRPSREDLRLVRDAIEVDNVAKVVSRRADDDVAAFLAAQRRSVEDADDGDPGEAAGLAEFFFHTDLAELAGNRALNLFLRILVELFRRHWTSTMQPMPQVHDAEEVHHAHARIVDAILDGDDSMAVHRSRRHLEALSSWWL